MKTLVLGASGATGKLVVSQLLKRNITARIVLRETAITPVEITDNKNIEIVRGNIDEFNTNLIQELMLDCDSVICCLGHNINFKGMFGPPYKLVMNSVKKISEAILTIHESKKLVLMSTTAYTNKKQGEENTFGEKLVFSLLEIMLPPHKDNMLAGDYLVYGVGTSNKIEWVAVRPDSLFDEENESVYELYESKIRSPIFNSGKTSRINVSHFMVELLTNDKLWQKWKYNTPVIYNKE
ncbi:SDR family oxidoreductase [bacterium]|nr:SDR family oxidoreductase [bacterium]